MKNRFKYYFILFIWAVQLMANDQQLQNIEVEINKFPPCTLTDITICLELEKAQVLSENDVPNALILFNKFIDDRESKGLYDHFYVSALYLTADLYLPSNESKALELFQKAQKYDSRLPDITFENGYLIMDNMPQEVVKTEETRTWMKKVMAASGVCDSVNDIQIKDKRMTIKLKPCCQCPIRKDTQKAIQEVKSSSTRH